MTFLANMISLFIFVICSIGLAIYSYGFLDFNLTLSSSALFLDFLVPLQKLVYFNRNQSAQIFIVIFLLFTLSYIYLLKYYSSLKIAKFPWKYFLGILAILTLSYPMLSYDIFNYMFHGKILWYYHANPHTIAPQEFTGDLWLRFMRWVHTPSAYGQVFTAIESPAYLLGMGKFVPTLYLMKITMSAFFAWCIYLIGKMGNLRSQLFIAFNPFLLLELVVNAHNDAVMIAFLLLAIYLASINRKIYSLINLILSIGVKYMTALTFPFYFIKNSKLKIIFIATILYIPVLFSPARFQPWYLVWSLIPASLIDSHWSRLWIISASLTSLIYYVPYIATGFWNNSYLFVAIVLYLPLLTSGSIWSITKIWKLRN